MPRKGEDEGRAWARARARARASASARARARERALGIPVCVSTLLTDGWVLVDGWLWDEHRFFVCSCLRSNREVPGASPTC